MEPKAGCSQAPASASSASTWASTCSSLALGPSSRVLYTRVHSTHTRTYTRPLKFTCLRSEDPEGRVPGQTGQPGSGDPSCPSGSGPGGKGVCDHRVSGAGLIYLAPRQASATGEPEPVGGGAAPLPGETEERSLSSSVPRGDAAEVGGAALSRLSSNHVVRAPPTRRP